MDRDDPMAALTNDLSSRSSPSGAAVHAPVNLCYAAAMSTVWGSLWL